jgi:hypothetical protein
MAPHAPGSPAFTYVVPERPQRYPIERPPRSLMREVNTDALAA